MLGCLTCFCLLLSFSIQFDPTCVDELPDCDRYRTGSCSGIYEPWARVHCNNTCKFCIGPTTPAPLCRDTLPNCIDYDHDTTCNDPQYKHWVEDNCRLYCRKCTTGQLAAIDNSKPKFEPCRDHAPNCSKKGLTACNDPRELLWASTTCKKFCGLC